MPGNDRACFACVVPRRALNHWWWRGWHGSSKRWGLRTSHNGQTERHLVRTVFLNHLSHRGGGGLLHEGQATARISYIKFTYTDVLLGREEHTAV